MVVSVGRAPLSPSSLPGYLSATEPAGGLWTPARPSPHLSPIIIKPGDITHMLTPGQAPSTLTKIRVAKQANKSLCHLKLMGFVIHPGDHFTSILFIECRKSERVLSAIVREQVVYTYVHRAANLV